MINMERKDGYLVLQEVSLKNIIERDNGKEMPIIEIDNQQYYFKECDEEIALLNIFCSEIAKSVDIKTVDYDLAIYNNKGIISNNYNQSFDEEVTLLQLLKDYYIHLVEIDEAQDIYDFNDLYNLEVIWESLNYRYQDKRIVKKLMDEIIDSFVLQIFIGNQDLHYKNISIIEADDPFICPNYDYDRAFLVDFAHSFYPYALEGFYREKVKTGKKNPEEVIEEILLSSDNSFRERFISKFHLLLPKEVLLLSIQNKLGIDISNRIPKYYLNKYDSYIENIKEIIEALSSSLKM